MLPPHGGIVRVYRVDLSSEDKDTYILQDKLLLDDPNNVDKVTKEKYTFFAAPHNTTGMNKDKRIKFGVFAPFQPRRRVLLPPRRLSATDEVTLPRADRPPTVSPSEKPRWKIGD